MSYQVLKQKRLFRTKEISRCCWKQLEENLVYMKIYMHDGMKLKV